MTTEKPKRIQRPLPKSHLTFCEKYAHCEDLEQAAAEAGLAPEMGVQLWQSNKIRQEVKRLRNLMARERAKIAARKNIVQVHKLDKELMVVAQASIRETPQLATPKLNAIELGYRRAGLLIDDNFVPDQPPAGAQASSSEAPRIFRAVEQKILTHQITTQEITRREVVGEVQKSAQNMPEIIPPARSGQQPSLLTDDSPYSF